MRLLGKQPQKLMRHLEELHDWKSGVIRYLRPIDDVTRALAAMSETGQLSRSGKTLLLGTLHEVAPQFVPPDSMGSVPKRSDLRARWLLRSPTAGSSCAPVELQRCRLRCGDGLAREQPGGGPPLPRIPIRAFQLANIPSRSEEESRLESFGRASGGETHRHSS